jgi:hypothetical protein
MSEWIHQDKNGPLSGYMGELIGVPTTEIEWAEWRCKAGIDDDSDDEGDNTEFHGDLFANE